MALTKAPRLAENARNGAPAQPATADSSLRNDKGLLASLFRADLELLDFAVGHDTFPDINRLACKPDLETMEGHASAFALLSLVERFGYAERREARRKIFDCLVGEVAVAILRKQVTVDSSLLK